MPQMNNEILNKIREINFERCLYYPPNLTYTTDGFSEAVFMGDKMIWSSQNEDHVGAEGFSDFIDKFMEKRG
jgi:hypothetical protein